MLGRHINVRRLQVFEATSRLRSLSEAAKELGITQSAVSHHLAQLTDEMGERLYERSGRTIILTAKGRTLSHRLQIAFAEIGQSVADVIGAGGQSIRLAVYSSFAQGWLIRRLDRFLTRFPGVDLSIEMYAQDPELSDRIADAFVTSLPRGPGFWSARIATERLIPVHPPNAATADIPLITTDIIRSEVGLDWIDFTQSTGVTLDQVQAGRWLVTSHYVLALEMARQGLGMALVPDFLAAGDIDSGKLTRLCDRHFETGRDYFLCIKETRRREPGLLALAGWMREEANRTP